MAGTGARRDGERGFVLLLTLMQGVLFMTVLTGILQLAMTNYVSANRTLKGVMALSAAEAGAEAAIFRLNQASNSNASYSGTTPPTGNVCALATSAQSGPNRVVLATSPTSHVTYESCVVDSSNGPNMERTIYAVGKAYGKPTATVPQAVRRVKLIVSAQVSGNYSVQSGNGGLELTNSAKIANGNVYVNGTITMGNTSSIGTPSAPARVFAANNACPKTPPYAGYPALCTSGQAITITTSARLYGEVHANGQTNAYGMSNGGIVQTSGVNPLPLPGYDRDDHKARATNVLTGSRSCNGSQVLTIAANTKITGNLTGGNTCQIVLGGDVWVTGNVVLNQSAVIRTGTGLADMPVMMVDGPQGVSFNQQSGSATNSAGIGTEFITFWSRAACSPDCPAVTGADLYESTPIKTIELGNQSLSAGSRFYARWTAINIAQGGAIGSVAAQLIRLSNSGSITFSSNQGAATYSWVSRYYEPMAVPDARSTN